MRSCSALSLLAYLSLPATGMRRVNCVLCHKKRELDSDGVCTQCREIYNSNLAASELEETTLSQEGKSIVSLLTKKMEALVSNLTSKLEERDQQISQLKDEISVLKKDITKANEKLDEVETQERRYSVIVSGKSTPVCVSGENTKNVASDLIKNVLKTKIDPNDIVSAFRMGRTPASQQEDRRSFIIKFRHQELASEIVKSSRTIKPSGIFVSENLTPLRHSILRVLRNAKHSNPTLVRGCGSQKGRVFAWVNPPNPQVGNPGTSSTEPRNVKYFVNNTDQLKRFCETTLNKQLEDLVEDWEY